VNAEQLAAEITQRSLGQEVVAPNGKAIAQGHSYISIETFHAATLDLRSLAGQALPERPFAWKSWIPAGTVTLLHGFGGVGKSLLAQQIATAYAIGKSLFGGETEGKPVLLIAGEDDHDEVWRRQVDICKRLDVSMAELQGRLILIAAPHIDITIADAGESGHVRPTATYAVMRELIERHKPGLIILHNSAKLFAIGENDRVAVTRSVGLLQCICHDFGVSILLVAHNNKDGLYSGSTAWENGCRSRLSLTRDDEGEVVTLSMPKANYAALSSITLRYNRGSFQCEDEARMTTAERLEAEAELRKNAETFLAALDELTAQGRNMSHSNHAQNYAPKAIIAANLHDGLSCKQLEAAMELLFAEKRIEAGAKVGERSQRSPKSGIARPRDSET
jgi:RecA-family ATPase